MPEWQKVLYGKDHTQQRSPGSRSTQITRTLGHHGPGENLRMDVMLGSGNRKGLPWRVAREG